jgi:hypothetical protein
MVHNTSLRKILVVSIIAIFSLVSIVGIHASGTSNFQQTINPGTLVVDIVDGSYVTVGSPAVIFPAVTFSFACQTNTSTFGTPTQQIYIQNPDSADNGWTVSIAGSAATAVWDGAASDYDFNDPTSSGCADGVDSDSVAGRMTVDPSVGTLAVGNCSGCATTNITKGSSTAFNQGTTDSITLLTAAAGADDIGDYTFRGIGISQTIPAQQGAASDYDINMVVSIVAN